MMVKIIAMVMMMTIMTKMLMMMVKMKMTVMILIKVMWIIVMNRLVSNLNICSSVINHQSPLIPYHSSFRCFLCCYHIG